MTAHAADMTLSIEVGSDPIAGSLSVEGEARQFCGWIELVAAIESVRHAASDGADQGVGSFPGANGGGV